MSVRDWIQTKKSGGTLTTEQVHALVAGVTDGTIADSQTASLLMAICLKGMTPEETAALTDAMLDSGRRLEWKAFGFPTVDKHSTGGVGDLISLPLAPAVAACGGHVPMISGRSLGHSGGTLDKLESIPGFRVDLSLDRLQELTADLGFAFGAATSDIAPADRHIYALRDATGTVESIPLITASILSKKAAEGLTGLVLDVKTGSGAFMVQLEDARALAHSLVETSARLGIHTVALITDMSKPLGRAVGNGVEVAESIEVLAGGGPADVVALTKQLGGEMLHLCGRAGSPEQGAARISASLRDGTAMDKFRRIIEAQCGNAAVIEDLSLLPKSRHVETIRAERDGVVTALNCRTVGVVATKLGAGREGPDHRIHPGAGLLCNKKVGDAVQKDDVLVEVQFDDPERYERVRELLRGAWTIGSADQGAPEPSPLVIDRIERVEGETNAHGG